MKLKYNIYILFISIIILLNLHFFYLLDAEKFHLDDICILVEIVFALIAIYPSIKRPKKKDCIMLLPFIMAITSAISAHISYNQPILLGLRPQRFWLMAMFMVFPIGRLIKRKKITYMNLFGVIDNIMCVYIVVVLAQYILSNYIIFMHVYTYNRYGSIRLYVSTSLLTLSYFVQLEKIYRNNKLTLKSIYIIGGTLLIYLFVTKSRMGLFLLFVGTLVAVLIKKGLTKRIAISICGAVVAIGLFLTTSYGQIMLNSFIDKSFESAGTEVRVVGRQFYKEILGSDVQKFLFGAGYVNTQWGEAVTGSMMDYKDRVSYDDNGWLGLMFYYGAIIIVWLVILHYILIKRAYKNKKWALLAYILKGMLGLYTLFPVCYVTDISFAIVYSLIMEEDAIQIAEDCRK